MINDIKICWNKTKKNVEKVIEQYIYYCLSIDCNSPSVIREDFSLEELDESIENIYLLVKPEIKKERVKYINYFRLSFNKLTIHERKIIYWTYLDKDNDYDDRYIANTLGFSLGYYYIRKKETLIRFAYSLGVEEIV